MKKFTSRLENLKNITIQLIREGGALPYQQLSRYGLYATSVAYRPYRDSFQVRLPISQWQVRHSSSRSLYNYLPTNQLRATLALIIQL